MPKNVLRSSLCKNTEMAIIGHSKVPDFFVRKPYIRPSLTLRRS
jgi:hypothetical protein